MKRCTKLSKKQDNILRREHIEERFKYDLKNVSDEIFNYSTLDCFLVISERSNKYLIGKLRKDYRFCPGDWDFLTPHWHPGDKLREKALEIPKKYAGLKPIKIFKNTKPIMWLDIDSKVWWYFLPFVVKVRDEKFKIYKTKKFSEFKWVKRGNLPKYSRQKYFEFIFDRVFN